MAVNIGVLEVVGVCRNLGENDTFEKFVLLGSGGNFLNNAGETVCFVDRVG